MESGLLSGAVLRRSPTPGRDAVLALIVMPAYNAEAYIGAALGSALEQSEKRLEILVVDDGSTDRTGEIARAAAAADERVRYVRMEVNAGPAAARNRALGMARGAWIALLDADDRFHPRRLERLVALGERVGADVVSDNLLLCDASGHEPDALMIPHEQLLQETRLTTASFIEGNIGSRKNPRCSYGFMQPLFRREFLEAHGLFYDERNRFAEDFLFYVECLTSGAKWWVTPEPMYYYTIRKGSLTEQQSSADLMRLRSASQRLLADPQAVLDPVLYRALRRHSRKIDRNYYYRAFTDAVKGRQFDLAARLLFESTDSLNLVVRESARQAPVIVKKALWGGYKRKTSLAS